MFSPYQCDHIHINVVAIKSYLVPFCIGEAAQFVKQATDAEFSRMRDY